jgi:hypothetical protein
MAAQNGARRISTGLGLALAVTFLHLNATAADVGLGTANSFGVLGATAITSADTGSTVNGGNVGLSPGVMSSITGIINVGPGYSVQAANAVTLQAQNDLTIAYGQAAGALPVTQDLTGKDLGTVSTVASPLAPGVYSFSSSAQLTGTLYLNDGGNPDAVFIFKIGSTLTTASGSSVVAVDGPNGPGSGISVFWQVGSSATLGTGTDFEGNILALTSITADTGATVDGRLLAENGAVSLDDNTINVPVAETETGTGTGQVPEAGSTILLLGSGLAALFAFGRRFPCPA